MAMIPTVWVVLQKNGDTITHITHVTKDTSSLLVCGITHIDATDLK